MQPLSCVIEVFMLVLRVELTYIQATSLLLRYDLSISDLILETNFIIEIV